MASVNHMHKMFAKKDFENLTKKLVYKYIQIIVQSRFGMKRNSQSKPFSSKFDSFNLAVENCGEVTSEIQDKWPSGKLSTGCNVGVKISLTTNEGDSMMLENWSLSLNENIDQSAKSFHIVYNRFTVLLKSLILAARITPAYRLSRKQGSDSYIVCYQICNEEPQTNRLGLDHHVTKVGEVPTVFGTVQLTVAYRTKMLLSHPTLLKELTADFKDDHFKNESNLQAIDDAPKPCYMVSRNGREYKEEYGFVFEESVSSLTLPPSNEPYLLEPSPLVSNANHKFSEAAHTIGDHPVPCKTFSDTIVKSPSGNVMVNKKRSDASGLNGIESIVQEDEEIIKSHDSDFVCLNKPFVSDGESDSDDEEKNSEAEENLLVKMVEEINKPSHGRLDNTVGRSPHSPYVAAKSPVPESKLLNLDSKCPQRHSALSKQLELMDMQNENVVKTCSNDKTDIHINGQVTADNIDVTNVSKSAPVQKSQVDFSKRLRRAKDTNDKKANEEEAHVSSGQAEDFLFVDANSLEATNEKFALGQFYNTCKNPPELSMFNEQLEIIDQDVYNKNQFSSHESTRAVIQSIDDQLEMFELQAQDFDEFVNSLSMEEPT